MKKAAWRTLVGAGAAVTASMIAVMLVASPGAAHVTVNPAEAVQGGYARVDFRAPNEIDTETTTQLEVYFPEEEPIPTVRVAPVPGWSVEVTRRTLDEPIEGGHGELITEVVEVITWTADSEQARIQPGEFQEFPVSMGPMPHVDELFFRALQTYSDGTVVRWIELPEEGAELDYPAASLRLAAGGGDGHSPDAGGHGDSSEPDQSADDVAGEATTGTDSTAGVWLGLAGLLAGLAGLVLGGVAFVRTRR